MRTEPYLGAGGHLVALREGDLAFLHVHPTGDGPDFEVEFPTPGRYRLFLQFKHEGRVHTAAFTREVEGWSISSCPIAGMTCASCANRVERKLNTLEGVSASVNYATEKATVEFEPGVVARASWSPRSRPPATRRPAFRAARSRPRRHELAPLRRARWSRSALLSLPVLLISMIPALQFDNWQWLALQLATPVVLWGAWPFHRAAWANLKHAAATMDTLVSVGVLAAWGWSLYALFLGDAGTPGMRMGFDRARPGTDEIYLETAAVVTTFILAGRYFEARAKRRAGAALEALLELGAKEARCSTRRRERGRRSRRLASATASWCGRARRSPTDGVVDDGPLARSTSRC